MIKSKKLATTVVVPADVPEYSCDEYIKNFTAITHNTGRLFMFAADQKIEHLNQDFYWKLLRVEGRSDLIVTM